MPQRLILLASWSYDHVWNLFTGLLFAILGYFAEIKGAIHVMWISFIFDLFIGILASVSVKKEKFSMKKAFVAFERMAVASLVVMLLYAMDKEMNQEIVSLYNIVAWIISGFLVYSMAENGFTITGGKLLLVIKSAMRKKVKEQTGVDMDKV